MIPVWDFRLSIVRNLARVRDFARRGTGVRRFETRVRGFMAND